MKKDLVQIIRDNPGCVVIIDNDYWRINKEDCTKAPDEKTDPVAYREWEILNELASSYDDIEPLGDGGYGSGNRHGGAILQALAVIAGIKVESV